MSRAARTALLLLLVAALGGVAWWAMETRTRWCARSSREVPRTPDAPAAVATRLEDAPLVSGPSGEAVHPSAPTRETEARTGGDPANTLPPHGTVGDSDAAALAGARAQG